MLHEKKNDQGFDLLHLQQPTAYRQFLDLLRLFCNLNDSRFQWFYSPKKGRKDKTIFNCVKQLRKDDKKVQQREEDSLTYEPQQVEELRKELHESMDYTYEEKKQELMRFDLFAKIGTRAIEVLANND